MDVSLLHVEVISFPVDFRIAALELLPRYVCPDRLQEDGSFTSRFPCDPSLTGLRFLTVRNPFVSTAGQAETSPRLL
jgi:hypothetical protein